MFDLIRRLFPICRSLTGNGNRETLDILGELIPLNRRTVASGSQVGDWVVPDEWSVEEAYVETVGGKRVIDFADSNLHLLSYSIAFEGELSFDQLESHLYHSSRHPEVIPYLSCYYRRDWGFCLTYRDYLKLDRSTRYRVVIRSKLAPGLLDYADLLIPGQTDEQILISTYFCHPSLANDNLSGLVLTTYLAQHLLKTKNYYSYRFIFIPETIGAVAYINLHRAELTGVVGGYVVTCVGDPGEFHYLKSRMPSLTDRVTLHTMRELRLKCHLRDFTTAGSDERQYNYPGVDLGVGSLMRSKYGEFPEYHTSADNLDFITPEALDQSFEVHLKCLEAFEQNRRYRATTVGEPMLGRHGLYPHIGGQKDILKQVEVMMSILYYSDGDHDLIDVAQKLEVPLSRVFETAEQLAAAGVIEKI